MNARISNKRSRSSNWSESEKVLLTQLIKEKINIIENKDVSKNNNQIKKTAWQEILQSFNEMNDTRRDLTQLHNQWRNTKNNIKKRNYDYRRNCNVTGGGPPPPSPPPEDVEIMEILPNEFVVDCNKFDSDSLNIRKDHDIKENNVVVIDISQPGCSGSTLGSQTEKNDMAPNNLECKSTSLPERTEQEQTETPMAYKNIKKGRKRVIHNTSESQQLFELAKSSRLEQLKFQEAEHNLKMHIMQKEHSIRLEILNMEHKYWEKKLAD